MSNDAERHALRGSGRALAGTLAGRAVQFVAMFAFYALAARALAVADFGRVMLGLSLVQLGSVLARRGLDQALLAAPQPRALAGFARRQVALGAMLAALCGALVLIAAGWADATTLLLCAALPPAALAQLGTGLLRAEGDVMRGNVAEALQPLAAFAFGALAWWVAWPGAFVLAWLLSWGVSLAYTTLHARAPAADPVPAGVARGAKRALLATGGSMAGVYLLGQVSTTADSVLLGLLASVSEVARYAPAQKIAAAFAFLHSAFTVAASPMLRRYVHDRILLQRYLRMMARLGTALGLPLAVLVLGEPGWLPSLFGEAYAAQSGEVLRWLALGTFGLLLTGPLGNVLLGAGHADALLRNTVFGTVLLLVAVALLAPGGAERAAIGVTLAMLTARATMLLAGWRRLGVQPLDPALLPLLAAGTAGVLLVRVLAPALGPFAANAVGVAVALSAALAVLARTRDLHFLYEELVRAPR
jgi:O-antigen/teichoic acid export membrane protein